MTRKERNQISDQLGALFSLLDGVGAELREVAEKLERGEMNQYRATNKLRKVATKIDGKRQ